MDTKIRVGIVGGAGYTAGELLRILIHHPNAEITFINSSSNAGNPIADIHEGLIGETELHFTSELPLNDIDVLQIPANVKTIDLAQDFRDESDGFVYGLPELNRKRIQTSSKIANPGCFATAIQIALLPLASAGLLKDDVHVNAITGSTGAGVKPSATSHFSWRNNNISIYKAFEHQHLKEIGQSIRQLQADFAHNINFIPVRGDFTRGIFVTAYTKCDLQDEEARQLYKNFYADAAFTFVAHRNPDLKQVVNTNKAIVYTEKHGDKLLLVSMIDNLLKGASGQAVQNMNLIFGLDEKAGLNLKAGGF